MGPVVAELAARNFSHDILLTGQHTSLLAGTPAETDLAAATSLGVASTGNVSRWLHTVERTLRVRWRAAPPQLVVVQGDTMSALAGARAADACGVPVAHIEAGVRSHDIRDPWPEERIRVEIAQVASWHAAPTGTAAENLAAEGVTANVRVTGNTVVSALARYAPDVRLRSLPEPIVLVTLHRREIQERATVAHLYDALRLAAAEEPHLTFAWPVHPAVEKLLQRGLEPTNLVLGAPMAHPAFLRVLAAAGAILSDSGGVVEEAATLGVPCAVLRAVNDRPEAEAAGIAKRFPPTPAGVFAALEWWPAVGRRPTGAFGGVESAANVANLIVEACA